MGEPKIAAREALFSFGQFQNEVFRSRHEDVLFVDRGGDYRIYAVADGFSKEPDGEAKTGFRVAHDVIGILAEHAKLIKRFGDMHRNFAELFALIDEKTCDELSGATFALAFVDLRAAAAGEFDLWSAVLGDAYVASLDAKGRFVLNPSKHIDGLGRNLWGCFGDRENRSVHSTEPEVMLHRLSVGSAFYVASDGACATDNGDVLAVRARQDLRSILDGHDADYIIREAATFRHSIDNITVIAERF